MRRRYYQPQFIQRRIANRQHREYEEIKRAIFKHLGARRTFVRDIDVTLIEQAARLYADWLYVEELLSSDEGKTMIWKYADALAKIHSMLVSIFDELEITPKMRGKIFQEIVHDDEITLKLKKLVGTD
ncbi:MAG TPA: hypothetical protein VLU95_06340 [Candidatus Acidoferrum sp.]|nr:hypothetical protein [Candidatus Acidoferrum sp.]